MKKKTLQPKNELLKSIPDKPIYAFSINYRDYFYIEQNDIQLWQVFDEIKKNKNSLYCEYVTKNSPVNFKIDFDTFDNIDNIMNESLNAIQIGLNKLGYNFDLDNDIFIYNSPDKIVDGKTKLSRHVMIRGKNWCFDSKKDIKYFIQNNNIPNLDMSVYHDTLFRCPYSSKQKENRFALPANHLDQDQFSLFKMGLMSYIEEKQKENIIKLTQENTNKEITFKGINKTIKSKLNKQEMELWKGIGINVFKKYDIVNKFYLYYSGKCVACDKIHNRQDGQKITIFTDLYNLINLKFNCWHNMQNYLRFWMNRNNVTKLNKNIENDYNINIKSIHNIIKYYGFNNEMEIIIELDEQIKQHHIKIHKEYLTKEDITNEPTLFIKSFEKTNKTGSISNYIKDIKNKKVIIACSNISTLASIRKRLKDDKIKYIWYKDATRDELSNDYFDILLITINSLYKICNEKEVLNNPNNYILWSDELSQTIRYIRSETLKDCRLKSYNTFQQLVKFSYKCIFSCADLNDFRINIINKERNKEFKILVNSFKNSKRIYKELDSKAEWFDNIINFIKIGKKIVILTDSKRKSDVYYKILFQTFPVNKFFLINSDNNNDTRTLENINEIIINYDVLIASPSLGIGINVNVIYFDNLFGCFSGASLTNEPSEQMLNRIRYLKDNIHYLHFYKVYKSKRMIDYDILNKIYFDIIKERDIISRELKLKICYNLNNVGVINYDSNDFITNLYVCSLLEKNISDFNYKYEFIKEILRRGAKFIIKGISLDEIDIQNNKKQHAQLVTEINLINLKKIDDILNVPLISYEEAMNLKNDSMKMKLSQNDSFRMEKYKLYRSYDILNKANINHVKNFILKITKGESMKIKMVNFNKFLLTKNIIDINEIEVIDAENIKKINIINKLLKELGFNNGLFSTIGVNPKNFKISTQELKQIRQLFRTNGDVGRFRDKNSKQHDFIKLVGRLCESIFGINIVWDIKYDKKTRIYYNYRLLPNDEIMEYLIKNFGVSLKKNNIDFYNFHKRKEFKYSYIHGDYGTFENFINNKEYSFIEQNELNCNIGEFAGSKDITK